MLRTRLWMGAILVAVGLALLFVDQYLAPWFPVLFLVVMLSMEASTLELLGLLGPARRLPTWFCAASVAAILAANWAPLVLAQCADLHTDVWHWILGAVTAVVLTSFVVEMGTFREPGESVTRVAVTVWVAAYVGLLPCFFAQMRWLAPPGAEPAEARNFGTVALALAIFVPKGGDIGAYMTGRFLGRHRMTPVLSPKKTWEGFAGGLLTAVVVAVALYQLDPVLRTTPLLAVGFGVSVWVASVLGDLAESLIKRDCRRKDASAVVPGFGGVLDVVDSIVFAAPVAYCWLRL